MGIKIAVLDASTLGGDLSLKPLEEIGTADIYPSLCGDELVRVLKTAEAVIVNKIKLNETNLKYAENLKLICVAATGYDNIDVEYCRKRGIGVCNAVGYSSDSVAQLTLAIALNLYTNIPQFTEFVRSGEYTKSGVANRLTPVYHEISGKTWGILGFGNIGRRTARAAEALGCKIIVCARSEKQGYENVDTDELCRRSDILSVHTPLTDETYHIINRERLKLMKRTAILINVARGAVTDEKALAEAVKNGEIGGIGVDVYDGEPLGETNPLYEIKGYDNVCLTPHMAWGAYEARGRCLNEMIENIKAFLDGGTRNRVDLIQG